MSFTSLVFRQSQEDNFGTFFLAFIIGSFIVTNDVNQGLLFLKLSLVIGFVSVMLVKFLFPLFSLVIFDRVLDREILQQMKISKDPTEISTLQKFTIRHNFESYMYSFRKAPILGEIRFLTGLIIFFFGSWSQNIISLWFSDNLTSLRILCGIMIVIISLRVAFRAGDDIKILKITRLLNILLTTDKSEEYNHFYQQKNWLSLIQDIENKSQRANHTIISKIKELYKLKNHIIDSSEVEFFYSYYEDTQYNLNDMVYNISRVTNSTIILSQDLHITRQSLTLLSSNLPILANIRNNINKKRNKFQKIISKQIVNNYFQGSKIDPVVSCLQCFLSDLPSKNNEITTPYNEGQYIDLHTLIYEISFESTDDINVTTSEWKEMLESIFKKNLLQNPINQNPQLPVITVLTIFMMLHIFPELEEDEMKKYGFGSLFNLYNWFSQWIEDYNEIIEEYEAEKLDYKMNQKKLQDINRAQQIERFGSPSKITLYEDLKSSNHLLTENYFESRLTEWQEIISELQNNIDEIIEQLEKLNKWHVRYSPFNLN